MDSARKSPVETRPGRVVADLAQARLSPVTLVRAAGPAGVGDSFQKGRDQRQPLVGNMKTLPAVYCFAVAAAPARSEP